MGRGKKKNNSIKFDGRAVNPNGGKTLLVPFKYFSNLSAVANIIATNMTQGTISNGTTTSTRLDALASQYTFYRFKDLRVTVYPNGSATCATYVVPSGSALAVSSLVDAMECIPSVYMGQTLTVPQVMKVNLAELAGQFKWFRISTTPDISEYQQGSIITYTSSATTNFIILYEGYVEYKGPIDITAGLKSAKEKLRAEVKQEFMDSLTPASTGNCLPSSSIGKGKPYGEKGIGSPSC